MRRSALVVVVVAGCGGAVGPAPTNQAQHSTGGSTGGASLSAELARMLGTIADQACKCKDAECAGGAGMAAMLLVNDLDEIIRKVPSEEPSFISYGDPELGEVDPMAGLDACWSKRAEWELQRAGDCYARLGGEHPRPQASAPACGSVARPAPPALDAWWTRSPKCPAGEFEETRSNSFLVRRCVDDGVTQAGRETRWWAYNQVPAYALTSTGWTYWYPDGSPAAMQTHDPATNTTELVRWYPNGRKRDERRYIGDEGEEEAGTRVDYWPNGTKRSERTYRGTHVRTYWYENGAKAAEVGFSDEARHGAFTYWHRNGKVKATGHYVHGQQHGIFEEHDETGAQVKRESFNFGQAGEPPTTLGKPKVLAATLLAEDLVRGLGGYTGALVAEETDMTDATTDHVRYRAPDKPASFDISLRLWVDGRTTARGWFQQLRDDYGTGKLTELKLADAAFVSEGRTSIDVVVHDKRGITLLLGCGKARCATTAKAIELARTIHQKLPARL